jgi:preprotein translocase subunit SecD
MNRYPAWKFAILVVALLLGVVYTLPNFFGEAPAVQVSSSKMSAKVDDATLMRVAEAIKAADVPAAVLTLEGNSIKARFETTEQQLKAKDAIQKALIPEGTENGYVVALNLLSRSPAWLTALHAAPMYLGLDLRGGVHFMLQVDMKAALSQKVESLAGDIRSTLREKEVRHGGISRNDQSIEIKVRDQAQLAAARKILSEQFADLQAIDSADGAEFKITATIKPEAARKVQEQALKQNITTLHNRINELGVAEPVIQ